MRKIDIPAISPAGKLLVRQPVTRQLDCGIPLHIYHQEDMEVFGLDIVYRRASLFAASQNSLLQSFTSSLVFSGTEKKSAYDIHNDLDFYGAYVSSEAHLFHTEISLYGLLQHFEKGVETFFDSVYHFSVPEDELSVMVKKEVSSHRIALQKPSYLCKRLFSECIWGAGHPAGKIISESDYYALKRYDLMAFKNNFYNRPELFFAGNFSESIIRTLNTICKQPAESGLIPEDDMAPVPLQPGIHHALKTGALQASLRMGRWVPGRLHPDYPAIFMASVILGGYFGSRLMKNIREDKGLTYGISARITPFISNGLFIIQSDCRNDAVQLVMDEINKELGILCETAVSIEELETARNYLLGVLIRGYDGLFEQKERCISRRVHGISSETVSEFFENIKKLTPENILQVSRNYFDKNTLTAVWSGDQS